MAKATASKQAMRGESGRRGRHDALNPTFTPEFLKMYEPAVAKLEAARATKIKARVVRDAQAPIEAINDNDAQTERDLISRLYGAIKVEFDSAAMALKLLPSNWKPRAVMAAWPEVVRTFWENYSNREDALDGVTRVHPTIDQLKSLDHVFCWLSRLRTDEMQIVLAHTAGMSFKRLGQMYSKSPMWAHNKYKDALLVIAITESDPWLRDRLMRRIGVTQ
jgi:hypothetical protein